MRSGRNVSSTVWLQKAVTLKETMLNYLVVLTVGLCLRYRKRGVFSSAEWHDGDWSSDGILEAWL
ncbi:hypothetical protein TNCV_1330191 [Trichonephila clavipes]|uniref:Uncharacterized protein n=1 Tax=Trichonephila clavipes TaxID=2585209 RepID=A0A8X6R7E0_TRICX|nr:hypothetical protein TNCV_1330191 [Trichonephila clavipes]